MHTRLCMTNPPRKLSPTALRVQAYAERDLKPSEIAILVHISTQRVYQILADLKERGEPSTEAAS